FISGGQLSHQGGRINGAGIGGSPLEADFVLSGGGFVSLAAIADAEKAVADNTRKHQKQREKYTMSHNITREYSDYPYC
ncbi:hypothetical protein, partial [Salmonella enterica]|uniref:hypothetical protein n=1 Tax=Salmonella enterica TaxID=28901 RepID=UPI001CE44189